MTGLPPLGRTPGALAFCVIAFCLAGCGTILGASKHEVRVTSEPEGAVVAVDGVQKGITPVTVTLTEEGHVLSVSHEGFQPTVLAVEPVTDTTVVFGDVFTYGVGFAVDWATDSFDMIDIDDVHTELALGDPAIEPMTVALDQTDVGVGVPAMFFRFTENVGYNQYTSAGDAKGVELFDSGHGVVAVEGSLFVGRFLTESLAVSLSLTFTLLPDDPLNLEGAGTNVTSTGNLISADPNSTTPGGAKYSLRPGILIGPGVHYLLGNNTLCTVVGGYQTFSSSYEPKNGPTEDAQGEPIKAEFSAAGVGVRLGAEWFWHPSRHLKLGVGGGVTYQNLSGDLDITAVGGGLTLSISFIRGGYAVACVGENCEFGSPEN